jgi:hypothetical protein
VNTQKDDTSAAVTPSYDWRAALLGRIEELDCAHKMLRRAKTQTEKTVLVNAILRIEQRAADTLELLGGLASPW